VAKHLRRDAYHNKTRENISAFVRDPQHRREKTEKEPNHERTPDKTPFLSQNREYKVCGVLGQEFKLRLRTLLKSLPKELPGSDRNLGLSYVIPASLGIRLRIEQHHNSTLLVLVQ
jgi:hypothetical protein